MEEDAASIEETIAADWESLTDWGEGHLPEKATPQFLAMVEKVKTGYRNHIDCLVGQLNRLRGQASRVVQLEAESAKMRRQLEEQGSPDVRRLRMKYTAQKEELRSLEEERDSLKLALSAAAAASEAKSTRPEAPSSPPALEIEIETATASSATAAEQ
ncbi:hypothetical protein BOX15_Mlig023507g1 [Macrostomum lignano]|nr:hypothetical protein BOX15_Mlig023507g1 [Macrostomum lignano]